VDRRERRHRDAHHTGTIPLTDEEFAVFPNRFQSRE
jgi:hypothetical protein